MIKKTVSALAMAAVLAVSYAGSVSAHVVVRPAEVETASFQTFTTGVPNEKDAAATTRLRLVMPAGLKYVSPTVKPGWTIETITEGQGEARTVKEIIWTGGSIPAGQRDDFTFSAQVPAEPTSLAWKAYQTYSDGETVNWDQAPNSSEDHSGSPYSETRIVNELSAASTTSQTASDDDSQTRTSIAIGLAVVAIVMSTVALTRKKA